MRQRPVVGQPAVGAKRGEVGQSCEVRECVGRDLCDVPEQIQIGHAVEAGKARQPAIGEGPVDQEDARRAIGVVGGFREGGDLAQQGEAGIGDEAPGPDTAQQRHAAQRGDGAVTDRRAHQVHFFQLRTGLQV